MAIYLIDYENTRNLCGISNLTESDTAIIFYSKNANTLTFETHKELSATRAKIEYKCVDVGGKNALDFQLATYLGFLLNENADIKIVSKDNGFSYVKSFWKKEKGVTVELFTDLSGKTQSKASEEISLNLGNALKQSSLKLSPEDIKTIIKTISQYKTKQAINNGLMKYFRDGEKVGAITKVIKPFIKDKK